MRMIKTAAVSGAACLLALAAACSTSPPGRTSRPGALPAHVAQVHSPAASRAPSPVITRAGAQQVLYAYASVNNQANKARSDSLLASIEAGSSYQMDTGNYRWTKVTDPANHGYISSAWADPTYFIPRQTGYPAWFAVRVTWTNLTHPQAGPTPAFLVFTKATAQAPWLEVLEPFVLAGAGPVPRIETDAQGYAVQVSRADAARLAVAPGGIPLLTAGYLDGDPAGQLRFTGSGSLADVHDQAFWKSRLPLGTDTDRHSATQDHVFGLRCADGGALLFYDLSARLTLVPPYGQTMNIQIPGFYSASETVSMAQVSYAEQFAAYVPPGQGSPRVVADVSGITARG
jgi:hypothetical protein